MRDQYLKKQRHLAIDAIMKRFHVLSDCSSYINDFVGHILTANKLIIKPHFGAPYLFYSTTHAHDGQEETVINR
jgi:hypothetical protein